MKQTCITFFMLFSFSALLAQTTKPVVNYLGTATTISFQKKSYHLAWSSHPAANYYKQEYVTKGDTPDRFTSMLLVEAVTGGSSVKEAVAAKRAELEELKKQNPLVQYELFENRKTGEYMLDFLLSATEADGSTIIERNVYRYKSFTDKKGATGILLVGVSERSYGSNTQPFLATLKKQKTALVNAVAAMAWPAIKI